MTIALSAIALLLGPFVYALGRHQPTAKQILDGFVFITVAGIVCVYIVPAAIVIGGSFTLVFLLAGLLFPVAIEKSAVVSSHKAHHFVLLLAAIGLILHAMIDGIALLPESGAITLPTGSAAATDSVFGSQLAMGVILHRLPVGMAIWWSVRPTFGVVTAVASFALIIAATATAYFFGAPVVEFTETYYLAFFQAFVAGSIAHVVAFGVSHEHEEASGPRRGWGFRTGILLGLFLIFTVPHLH